MRKLGIALALAGIIATWVAMVIAAIKCDILCGIAVCGLFCCIIGLLIMQFTDKKYED